MNIENIKIDFYMFLWEKYNDVFSLKEFEDKVIEHLKSSEVFRKNQKIYYKVLKDFFLAHNIAFNEVGNPIFSKLEIINYEDNIFVDFLVKKMEKMDKIFFEQESKKDIKIIKQETLSVFLHRFENVLNKQESYEIIKASIRRFLSLSKKDSIFFLNEKVVIRYFNLSKEERSEGIPVEELEKIYKKLGYEYYSQMVDKLMKELLNKELDLNYMDNLTFHRTYIKIIQQGITKKLKGDFKEEQSGFKPFVNYVFRKHFNSCVMSIVDEILKLSSDKKNKKIVAFLKFYDGKELYLNGTVKQKPTLSSGSDTWYYNSIVQLTEKREELKKKYNLKKEETDIIRKEIKKLETALIQYKEKQLEFQGINPEESREYRYLIIDIKATEEEQNKRYEVLKGYEAEEAIVKKEFTIFEESIVGVKSAIKNALTSFRV